MTEENNLITIKNLHKSYGTTKVIKNVSFTIKKGEVFGLLGPNGSGKTTILETIIGLRKITKGQVEVVGFDMMNNPDKVRPFIGVQPQDANLFAYLKVGEILELFSSMYKNSESVTKILQQIDLQDMVNKPTRKLSGGQKKRLSIGIALIPKPEILFLDEPTASLDPHSRRKIWEIISSFKRSGRSVFLTTHSMEEAYTQCDRTAILHNGQFVALDTPDNLIQKHSPKQSLFLKYIKKIDVNTLNNIPEIKDVFVTPLNVGYQVEITAETITRNLLSSLLQHSLDNWVNIRIEPGTLEDVFIKLTGKNINGGELV